MANQSADTLKFARALRRDQTDAELCLWQFLRDRQLGNCKFRRQVPVGPYFLDFYCCEKKLAVELDGGGHADDLQMVHDAQRDAFLRRAGIRVLRYWNNQMLHETKDVLEDILSHLESNETPSP